MRVSRLDSTSRSWVVLGDKGVGTVCTVKAVRGGEQRSGTGHSSPGARRS